MVEAVHGIVQHSVDLGLHDRLRQRHLDLLQQGLQHLVADLTGLLDLLDALDPVPQVFLQLVEGVEFAGQLGEVVIGLRQFALLDRAHGDGDDRFLARMLTGDQVGGEFLGLVDRKPDERLVQALDQLAGADLVGQAGGGCLGHILAVDGGGEIDGDEVAVLDRTLHAGQGAETLAQRLQLLLDVLVTDGERVDGHLDAVVGRQGDLRTHVDLGGERQLLAVLDLGDLDLGLADDLDFGGGDGLAVAARQRIVDDLLEDRAAPQAGLDELGRGLARTEPGDANLVGQRLVGLVEVRLQLLERHLDVDPDPGRAQLLDGALHGHAPCSLVLVDLLVADLLGVITSEIAARLDVRISTRLVDP